MNTTLASGGYACTVILVEDGAPLCALSTEQHSWRYAHSFGERPAFHLRIGHSSCLSYCQRWILTCAQTSSQRENDVARVVLRPVAMSGVQDACHIKDDGAGSGKDGSDGSARNGCHGIACARGCHSARAESCRA